MGVQQEREEEQLKVLVAEMVAQQVITNNWLRKIRTGVIMLAAQVILLGIIINLSTEA